MSRGRKRVSAWLAIALLGAGLVVLWLVRRAEFPPPERSSNALQTVAGTAASASALPSPTSNAPPPSAPRGPAGSVRPISAEARRFRQRVLDSLASRERAAERKRAAASTTPAAANGGTGPIPGTMADRTGQLGEETMRVINHELMPLLGECYEQASERDPRLKGMLALAVKVADAEGIGGIIEDVEAAPGNAVPDEDLVECIRQSAFTIELPTPSQTARNGLQLTVPLGIQLEAGAGQ